MASQQLYPPHHTTLPHITKDSWRDHAAQKRQALADQIHKEWRLPSGKYDGLANVTGVPEECGILSAKELEITAIDDAYKLHDKIASGTYSAVEVATAYSKRAAIAHQLVNCLTEVFFDRALQRAKELDDHLKQTGKLVGPLHGVPVSLKDQFDIKGIELCMGYAAYLGRVSSENSSIVDLLEAAGAVLYVRTNIPQTLMIGDTDNHVFGRTHNPHNRKLSPGGSSGGEGALVAMKGSIIGVGTDIGGSVRIPSAFCGLYTIRPTTRRVPYGKATNSMLGQESIMSVVGPMTRSMNSVKLFMETIFDLNANNFDSGALPFAFNRALYDQTLSSKKYAFGVSYDNGDAHLAPPLRRAMDITVAALKKAGHEVVEFDMSKYKRATELAVQLFTADGGADVKSVVSAIDEPLIEGLGLLDGKGVSVHENWQLNREKEAMQQKFLSDWMSTNAKTSTGRPIDGLLCVAVPIPACIPGQNQVLSYTCAFNLLDLPATVFPVTTVDPKTDVWGSNKPTPFNSLDGKYIERFNPEESAGVPVTVQLVGRRWHEEALLALSARVIEALDADKPRL